MSQFKYPISIRPMSPDEGSGYSVYAPDLPGCMADGETIPQALKEIQSAIESWLATAQEFNDPIPKPNK